MDPLGVVLIRGRYQESLPSILRRFPCVTIADMSWAGTWAEAKAAMADTDIKAGAQVGSWTAIVDPELRLPGEARICSALATEMQTEILALVINGSRPLHYVGVHQRGTSRIYLQTIDGVVEDSGMPEEWELGLAPGCWTTSRLLEALQRKGVDLVRLEQVNRVVLLRAAEVQPEAREQTYDAYHDDEAYWTYLDGPEPE